MQYFPLTGYAAAIIGAGSGIGREVALYIAKQGVSVHCLDRDKAGVDATVKQVGAAGGQARGWQADVSDAAGAKRVLQEVIGAAGALQALVNCAGITGKTNVKAHEVELDDFDAVYRVNLRGALIVSQAVLPHMIEKKYGRILHIASIAGKDGNAGMAAYSATKAGLIGLVKTMGKDYAESGITVNALAPAVIRTPMVAALPDATVKYMTDKIPMKRCGELEEAAQLIAWTISPACSFTTGFTFDLTGGRATY